MFFTAGVALRVAGEGMPFEQGLRDVVALGGDTDTNAPATAALPITWLARLQDSPAIEDEARALARLVIPRSSDPDS